MAEKDAANKERLLTKIERAWSALTAALDRLTPAQMTAVADDAGWTVRDHVIHLAVWERSVVQLLAGRPRHEGLGVDRAVYETGDDDAINQVIYAQHTGLTLEEARAQLLAAHDEMVAAVRALPGDALRRPYGAYAPQERDDERLVADVIAANSYEHYAEHQAWIEALV